MTIVAASPTLWEALAGRAPDRPLAPADPGLWAMVQERLNPARARPVVRAGIEQAPLESARGVAYVMLRSPEVEAAYVRLTPEEAELTGLMDGSRTVAELIRAFLTISGTLAPRQVVRVVADLAGARMLEELPVDAFASVARARRRPLPLRIGHGLLGAARGKRMVLGNPDRLVGFLHRAGGRFLFTRPAVLLMALVGVSGFGVFINTWVGGGTSAFVSSGSYAVGAVVLLGLNFVALASHELGHALATKHAGRRVTAVGALLYFGIPSVFVDTTDVWMADRRARLRTTAAGPVAALTLAGLASLVGLAFPPLAPVLFKLSLAWYINSLFNLNPLMALDGYYLLMDWLEVPNLRPRSVAFIATVVRRRRAAFAAMDREGQLVAAYAGLTLLWTLVSMNLAVRMYRDRVSGLVAGLWHRGVVSRVLLVAVIAGLLSPLAYGLAGLVSRRMRRVLVRVREARDKRDGPRREAVLRASELRTIGADGIAGVALASRWVRPSSGADVVVAGATVGAAYVVVDGYLESRRRGDPTATVRERVGPGRVVALRQARAGAPSPLSWRAVDAVLLAVPAAALAALPEPVGPDAEEAGEALASAPALGGLADDDRRALVAAMAAHDLGPDTDLPTDTADSLELVGHGTVVDGEGERRGRGELVASGRSRSAARVWRLGQVLDPAVLAGADAAAVLSSPAPILRLGVHGDGSYPPVAPFDLAGGTGEDEVDRRLLRRLVALLLLLLALFLLTGAVALLPSRPWSEIPAGTALISVRTGTVDVVVDGEPMRLHRGDQIVVSAPDQIRVAPRSSADLILRGGSGALLCPGADVDLQRIAPESAGAGPFVRLQLGGGRLVAETASASPAIGPAAVTVTAGRHVTANTGEARFAVAPGGLSVATGAVTQDDRTVAPIDAPLGCGGALASAGGSVVEPEPTTTTTASAPTTDAPTTSSSPPTTAKAPAGTGPVPTVAPIVPPTSTATTSDRPGPRPTTTTPRPTTTRPAPPPSTTPAPTVPSPTTAVPPPTTAVPAPTTAAPPPTTAAPPPTTSPPPPTTAPPTTKPTTTTPTTKPTSTTCPVVGCP